MSTMKRFLIATALVAGPLAALAPAAHADKHHRVAYHPKMSMDDARKIALARFPGTVKTEELEREKGRWIYSFEIRPTGETKKIVKEVNLDADTGKIVEIDTERE